MLDYEITKQELLFARTYFLTLMLTVVIVLVVSLFHITTVIFYLPFALGGLGSLLLYLFHRLKPGIHKIKLKIICHSFCSSIYIIGAFLMLVFYDLNFFVSWSYSIWIVSILIVTLPRFKQNVFIFILLFLIGMVLFVLDVSGLFGAVLWAMAMGGFWGFSFYYLLEFWNNVKTYRNG